ncbi:biotin--[acetyl-CoA-carboxylase] ligase [Membranicola marinus]|uniref:Biotin--[acetyl-CoA-carboxylase] ligase n=2 Tax=Membranihabitans marinus TaxID=1227546 RepID=A0A953HWN4_9BACT|nr:biotin--[acetyl-CoA-carboxylase] ligase [Membranihabitans marinus]
MELLSKSTPKPFTAISADFQTAGVGQIGSTWVSHPGENVLMSIIVYPDFINVLESFKLQFLASLTCVEVLTPYIDKNELFVKWPNDVLVNRKKIAGVLIRNIFMGSAIRSSVIGFGLNVNQMDFPGVENPVTSLKAVTGQDYDVPALRQQLLDKFRTLYDLLENGKSLKELYMMMLFGYEEPFSFYDLKDQSYKRGVINDVLGSGHLLVKVGGVVEKYDFKEIKFIMDA